MAFVIAKRSAHLLSDNPVIDTSARANSRNSLKTFFDDDIDSPQDLRSPQGTDECAEFYGVDISALDACDVPTHRPTPWTRHKDTAEISPVDSSHSLNDTARNSRDLKVTSRSTQQQSRDELNTKTATGGNIGPTVVTGAETLAAYKPDPAIIINSQHQQQSHSRNQSVHQSNPCTILYRTFPDDRLQLTDITHPTSSLSSSSSSSSASLFLSSPKRLGGVGTRGRGQLDNQSMSSINPIVPSTPPRTAVSSNYNGITSSQIDMTSVLTRSISADKDRTNQNQYSNYGPIRAQSEDRGVLENIVETQADGKKSKKDKRHEKEVAGKSAKNSSKDGFFNKGLWGKLTRSTSSNDKVGTNYDEEYEPKILKLPLIQQTRATRIAKSYDKCRDKTEFWMPALPWRCIDYLNGKSEEEGLYRVSGGLTNVRRWRRRFDTELDVNLLDEEDLYDASVIASLFKEWIRELPEEIFPKAMQARVAPSLNIDGPGKRPVPQALRDELSNLPPFNYYLLFAITCHLNVLLGNEPKNKMTLENLFRCFNQSLKLDGRVFYTLVGDWKFCWQGCYTENDYLRSEFSYLNKPFVDQELDWNSNETNNENNTLASSSTSAVSATGRSTPDNQRSIASNTQPSTITSGDSSSDLVQVTSGMQNGSLSPTRKNVTPIR